MRGKIKRRTKVVEILPDVPSMSRLVGTLLAGTDDEWQVERRYFSKASMHELNEPSLAQFTAPTSLTLAPVH